MNSHEFSACDDENCGKCPKEFCKDGCYWSDGWTTDECLPKEGLIIKKNIHCPIYVQCNL